MVDHTVLPRFTIWLNHAQKHGSTTVQPWYFGRAQPRPPSVWTRQPSYLELLRHCLRKNRDARLGTRSGGGRHHRREDLRGSSSRVVGIIRSTASHAPWTLIFVVDLMDSLSRPARATVRRARTRCFSSGIATGPDCWSSQTRSYTGS